MSTRSRPFKIDYAGCWPGFACTREGAIDAAGRHMTRDGYTRATVTDVRTDTHVASVELRPGGFGYIVTTAKRFRKVIR